MLEKERMKVPRSHPGEKPILAQARNKAPLQPGMRHGSVVGSLVNSALITGAQPVSAWQAFENHCGAEPQAEERLFSATVQSERAGGGHVNRGQRIHVTGCEKPNLRCLKNFSVYLS